MGKILRMWLHSLFILLCATTFLASHVMVCHSEDLDDLRSNLLNIAQFVDSEKARFTGTYVSIWGVPDTGFCLWQSASSVSAAREGAREGCQRAGIIDCRPLFNLAVFNDTQYKLRAYLFSPDQTVFGPDNSIFNWTFHPYQGMTNLSLADCDCRVWVPAAFKLQVKSADGQYNVGPQEVNRFNSQTKFYKDGTTLEMRFSP